MIFFYAEGNPDIGGGHIMRCLSIANVLRIRGQQCAFISSTNHYESVIIAAKHLFIKIDSEYDNPSLEEVCIVINKYLPEIVVVDSYYVTERFMHGLLEYVHNVTGKLIFIDDLIENAYSCDILINYNAFAVDKQEQYICMYSQESGVKEPLFLLGPYYAPLRAEFQNLKKRIPAQNVENVLVTTGGADALHFTLDLLRECGRMGQFNFCFIVGPLSLDRMEIEQESREFDNITIYQNVQDMCGLMRKCDIAISAAGSTLYELCATQTPTITFAMADNQIIGAESFADRSIMIYAGDARDNDRETFVDMILDLTVDISKRLSERCRMADEMAKLVDGNGSIHICDSIVNNV